MTKLRCPNHVWVRRTIERNVQALIKSFNDLYRKLIEAKEPFDEITAMNDEILLDSAASKNDIVPPAAADPGTFGGAAF